jgi:hypothetical protein
VIVIATISSTRLKPVSADSLRCVLGIVASLPQGPDGGGVGATPGAAGQIGGAPAVHARNVVNSARERAPAKAPVPCDRTRITRFRVSEVAVMDQRVWILPTPGISSSQV